MEDRVRAFVRAGRINKAELSRRLGYGDRSWGKYFMDGKKSLSVDRLEAVASMMNTTVSGLFTDVGTQPDGAAPPPLTPTQNLGRLMAWEFRRAAKLANRAATQAQLRDIAWSLEQTSAVTNGDEERPVKRRRARA